MPDEPIVPETKGKSGAKEGETDANGESESESEDEPSSSSSDSENEEQKKLKKLENEVGPDKLHCHRYWYDLFYVVSAQLSFYLLSVYLLRYTSLTIHRLSTCVAIRMSCGLYDLL